MMKKLLLPLLVVSIFLCGCKPQFTATDDILDYAAFLSLLESYGFSYEESGITRPGYLNAGRTAILVGGEPLAVYQYETNAAMETDAGYVGKCGFSVENLSTEQVFNISWVSNPYWFKKDLLIVNYVGTNEPFIDFLRAIFGDVFAGQGYRGAAADDVPPDDSIERENQTLTGHFAAFENGGRMIVVYDVYPDAAPIVMHNQSGNDGLFADLRTGDEIRIVYDGKIMESYPAKMNVFGVELIERGGAENIPRAVTASLAEMGWVILANLAENGVDEPFCDCELCLFARRREGVTPANVKIRFISNETPTDFNGINEHVNIDSFAAYHTFTEPDWSLGTRTVFTADITVNNFRFISLEYAFQLDDMCCDFYCGCVYTTDIFCTLDELTPEMPLVVEWNHVGCFTSGRGISFDHDGTTYYFDIVDSNYNGHLYLREFFP
jgi:hypothetical protein